VGGVSGDFLVGGVSDDGLDGGMASDFDSVGGVNLFPCGWGPSLAALLGSGASGAGLVGRLTGPEACDSCLTNAELFSFSVSVVQSGVSGACLDGTGLSGLTC
jgi:hypothetical protein